jgi:hypothetical protein
MVARPRSVAVKLEYTGDLRQQWQGKDGSERVQ